MQRAKKLLLLALTLLIGSVFLPWQKPCVLGSIVVVETEQGAKPPSNILPQPGPKALQGVPIDFRFYAVRNAIEGQPESEAVNQALNRLRNANTKNESISPGNESVLIKRPSLYVTMEGINSEERVPDEWLADVTRRAQLITQVSQSVGRIEVYYLNNDHNPGAVGRIAGTGFVVAPGIVMTNRHVAEVFTDVDDPKLPFRRDERTEQPAVVYINFAGIYGEDPVLFRVDKTLYIAPKKGLDVALLQLQPKQGGIEPPPLQLQNTKPDVDKWNRRVFACGYPSSDNDDDKRVTQYLRDLGVKRVSLGEVMGEALYGGHRRIFHNCTTLGGSSGSPMVDVETGTVWGLHFGGWWTGIEGNKAEPMWEICAIPEVQQILGPAATEPVNVVPVDQKNGVVAEKQRKRPVLLLHQDDIAGGQQFPTKWIKPDSQEHANVRRILPSVGLVEGSQESIKCSAFMVSSSVAIIPSHVANTLAGLKKDSDNQLIDISISFDVNPSDAGSHKFRVTQVLHVSQSLGIGLLAMEPKEGQALPPPLPMQTESPSGALVGQSVFLVGYAFPDSRVPSEVFSAVFPPPYGNKRLSLGKVTEKSAKEILHDCSSTGGYGGAPLVSLTTGKVMGIHTGGRYLQANYAIPMWDILRDPEIRRILEQS